MSTIIHFNNLIIPIIGEKREIIPRTWSSKVSLLSNFATRMTRLGLAQIETPNKTKSPLGVDSVLDQLMTKAIDLL